MCFHRMSSGLQGADRIVGAAHKATTIGQDIAQGITKHKTYKSNKEASNITKNNKQMIQNRQINTMRHEKDIAQGITHMSLHAVKSSLEAAGAQKGDRKGANEMGPALVGSLRLSCFSTEGLFGYSRSPTCIFPKVPRRTFFP